MGKNSQESPILATRGCITYVNCVWGTSKSSSLIEIKTESVEGR